MSARIFILAFLLLCGAGGASLVASDAVAYHSAETESQLTGLLKAAAEGNISHVEQYVKSVRPDKKGKHGDTALMWAAYKGHTSVVQYLLEVGADVNAEDKEDWTPLHNAASEGHAEIIKILIADGAKVNAEDDYDRTPLHWAAMDGHTDAVIALVAKGADVNAEDKDDWTPSHFAFNSNGRNKILPILVNAGASINEENDNGETVRNWLELIKVADLVEPELKKAEQLLGSGGRFNNASAAVAGAALERFLREWVKIEELDFSDDNKGIRVYAEALADGDKIEEKTHNNIKSWNYLRNYAAHGEWEKIKGGSVGEMLVCVRAFVQKHGRRMPSRREPNSEGCQVR